MSTTHGMKIKAVRPLAVEDLRRGDFVVVTHGTCQVLRIDCAAAWGEDGLRVDRVRYVPFDAGRPMKVRAVCLPFVYAVSTDEDGEAIDLRLASIARLPREAGRAAFDAMTPHWVREQRRMRKAAKKAQHSQGNKED
ncbi:MAG: hypothetical protein AAF586_00105 [Planctomycetota bacterium]